METETGGKIIRADFFLLACLIRGYEPMGNEKREKSLFFFFVTLVLFCHLLGIKRNFFGGFWISCSFLDSY